MVKMTLQKQWDVLSLLKITTDHFIGKQMDEARLQVEYLLAHTLQLNRMDLYLNFDRPVTPNELDHFRDLCKRKLQGEPLQYILGSEQFLGLKFKTDSRALIPRPETEVLIELVFEALKERENQARRVLDIGTGTGCIAISMANLFKTSDVVAVDVSEQALALAKENALEIGVENQVEFHCCDALNDAFHERFFQGFDVIISNPPYIPIREKDELQVEIKAYEPEIALFVEEGFEFYRKIASDANKMLNSGGLLAFEIHCEGKDDIEEILNRKAFSNINFHKDYSGLYRVVIAEK